jgi:hypothetical protein
VEEQYDESDRVKGCQADARGGGGQPVAKELQQCHGLETGLWERERGWKAQTFMEGEE